MGQKTYVTHHRCPTHRWVEHDECRDTDFGLICLLCFEETGKRVRVRTRPRWSNYAGEVIRAMKLVVTV